MSGNIWGYSKMLVLLILGFLCIASFEAIAQGSKQNTDQGELLVIIAEVVATNSNVSLMTEDLKKSAVVDGKVSFVIATDGKVEFDKEIPPELIMGFLANPKKGIVEGNVVRNPIFMQMICEIAAEHRDDELYRTIIESEAKTSILIDVRAKNPAGPIRKLIPDIIGFYSLTEDEEIVFEPNRNYRIVTRDGFIKLVPFIVEEMFKKYK